MLSIADFFGYALPYAQRYQLIKQAGFDGVLLWYGDDFGVNLRKYNLPALARSHGLQIENIHAPIEATRALWRHRPSSAKAFEGFIKCIDDCAQYEIPTIVIHPSFGRLPKRAGHIGCERFQALVNHAEKKGIKLAIENLRSVTHIAMAAHLLEHIDSPNFGFCYDSGHNNARALQNAETDLLSRFGNRLMALHLHDNDGCVNNTSADDQHRLPFNGTIDWTAQMRAIQAAGYSGATALEVNNRRREDMTPEEFLFLAYARAQKLDQLRK